MENVLPFRSTWILIVFQQLFIGENCSWKAEKGVSPLPCSQARLGHPVGAFSQESSRPLLVMQTTHVYLLWDLMDMGHQSGFSSVLLALSHVSL